MMLKMYEPPRGLDGMAIAREVFETDDEDWCGYALWNHTGWPCFFEGDPAQAVRRQLTDFAVALTLGLELCTLCGRNEARADDSWLPTCSVCREAMSGQDNGDGVR